ncbi:putative aminotransferase ACS12 [Camellia lanceoleosa]|uniref:Aminotransferase ACS12 n=1 Tax=Camellia lanceoleosa TaxID=1840588 RepID=A0ACC0GMW6_9ERIC|nr:putative aminotransferase ACS12 [Camellia lanceoleosa]
MWGLGEGHANISSRASPNAKPNDSPYHIGLDSVSEDSYDSLKNPNGIMQLGLLENRVCFCFSSINFHCIGFGFELIVFVVIAIIRLIKKWFS